MNKLFLILPLLGLFSCKSEDQPTDVTARASGKYIVQSYTVFGDTMYSTRGVNKIGVSDFYIVVDRKGPDSVRVGTFYTRKSLPVRFIKDVRVTEASGRLQLSAINYVASGYQGIIEGNTFTERSVSAGLLIPLADSSKSTYVPSPAGIIISAQK
ncbi:hypothetical protein GCM10027592_56340 [Spirosoma flavus]